MSDKSEAEQKALIGALSALQQYCTRHACEKCTVKDAIGCIQQPIADGSARRIHVCGCPANWDFTRMAGGGKK